MPGWFATSDEGATRAPELPELLGPDGLLLAEPWDAVARGRYPAVGLQVDDRSQLRSLRLPQGIRTTRLVIDLGIESGGPVLTLTPRPEWARLVQMSSGPSWPGVYRLDLEFAAPVPVHAVVAEIGRQSVWPDRVGWRGIVVAGEELRKVPADVDPGRIEVRDPDPTLELGPIDERIYNPTGFSEPIEAARVYDLRDGPRGLVPPSTWRAVLGVRASGSADPAAIAGLAMCGVPVVADSLSTTTRRSLGDAVSSAILTEVDLTDPLAREEHSVVLRRAAHTTFSTHAWRRRLGELSGVRTHHQPAVSVVMATRRPEMLEHALAQVARQRGVEQIELVLAPHGFEPASVPDGVVLAPAPAEAVFGDVLDGAVSRASGDVVLKMDDDDWYGPDFVADLLLARAWSGAELVGTPDDWHYLEPRDTTVRLGSPVEDYKQFVAGGSLLLDIGLLREVGGFRSVPRAVDAHLIGAVRAAGGAIYRTHGLGYVLRKTGTGHTWAEDVDDLAARATSSYDGFRPSRLMEL